MTNDTITSDARGSMQYEYMNDWYILPENPEQVTLHPDNIQLMHTREMETGAMRFMVET